ncbi:hypothetical protein L1887_41910 [Cichorium endivia]|nr:hypothetical protein L1887_41910 [Cichorium endivia]
MQRRLSTDILCVPVPGYNIALHKTQTQMRLVATLRLIDRRRSECKFSRSDSRKFCESGERPRGMLGTHDPLVLDAGLLNRSGLLELLGTGGGGVLGLNVSGVDDVGDAGDGGSGDDVDGEQLEVEPVLGGLDDLDGAAHATALTVRLLGVEEGTRDRLERQQAVLLGRVGDRKHHRVGLAILDDRVRVVGERRDNAQLGCVVCLGGDERGRHQRNQRRSGQSEESHVGCVYANGCATGRDTRMDEVTEGRRQERCWIRSTKWGNPTEPCPCRESVARSEHTDERMQFFHAALDQRSTPIVGRRVLWRSWPAAVPGWSAEIAK